MLMPRETAVILNLVCQSRGMLNVIGTRRSPFMLSAGGSDAAELGSGRKDFDFERGAGTAALVFGSVMLLLPMQSHG